MPIAFFTKPVNDVGEIDILLISAVDPLDSISRVDHGDLDIFSVNFTDVSGNALENLIDFYEPRGYGFLGSATADIEGRRDWGTFSTAESTIFIPLAQEGDYGYDMDMAKEVVFDGTSWILSASNIVDVINLTFPDGSKQSQGVAPLDINFRVSTLFESNSHDVSAQITAARGLYFPPSASKAYLYDNTTTTIYEYDLTAPQDLSVAPVFNGSTLTGFNGTGIFLREDGTSMHGLFFDGTIRTWEFSTPYDSSTAGAPTSLMVGPPNSVDFSVYNNGIDVLFCVSAPTSGDLLHFKMSVPWDWATLTDTGNVFSSGFNWGSGGSVVMRPDGRRCILNDPSNDLFVEFAVDVPWDITTMRQVNTAPSNSAGNFNFHGSADGKKIFAINPFEASSTVYEYTLGLETPILRTDTIKFKTPGNGGIKILLEGSLDIDVSGGTDNNNILKLINTGTNGANIGVKIGDRTPLNNISAPPGDLYFKKDAEQSLIYQNKGANSPNSTGWLPTSVLGSNVTEIFKTSDLTNHPLTSGGVMTSPPGVFVELRFSEIVVASVRFELGVGSILAFTGPQTYVYLAANDFISGTDIGGVFMLNVQLVAVASPILFNITGGTGLNSAVLLSTVILTGFNLGEIARATGEVRGPAVLVNVLALINSTGGLTLRDCTLLDIDGVSISGQAAINDDFFKVVSSNITAPHTFSGTVGISRGSDSLLRIDPGNLGGRLVVSNSSFTGSLFNTSGGITGTFTIVNDASILNESINSVTDASGVAQFNHSAGQGEVFVGQEVTTAMLGGNPTYNGIFLVTAAGAGFFRIASIAFVGNDSGGFSSDSITLTDTATVLNDGDTLVIDTDLATDYDGGAVVYNKQTNTFQINRLFVGTKTGTWDTAGLNQRDPRVLANANPGFLDSEYIGFASVNGNINATTITDGVYAPIVVTGMIENLATERFKLIDADAGIFEYIGIEPKTLMISATPSHVKTGSNQNYRYSVSQNGVVPVFATAPYQPAEITSTKKSTTFLGSSLFITGDTLQIMAAGDGTANLITVTDLAFNID